jgi:hypothetical protein
MNSNSPFSSGTWLAWRPAHAQHWRMFSSPRRIAATRWEGDIAHSWRSCSSRRSRSGAAWFATRWRSVCEALRAGVMASP